MYELQLLVFEDSRFLFQEKSDRFQFLALPVHKVSNVIIFSGNISIERCPSDRNLLIETMIDDIQNVTLKKIKSVYKYDP